MAETKSRVICVGEVMVELSRGTDARYGLSFGGDTFNTAVYLARAGVDAAYATAVGDDPYSNALIALATAENVNRDLIARVPGRMPGLFFSGRHSDFCNVKCGIMIRELESNPSAGDRT